MELEFTRAERNRGVYIVGKTRSGKSTFMKHLAIGDIEAGRGIIFIDPHGYDGLDILNAVPPHRTEEVCYLDLSDYKYSVGFRPVIEPHHIVTAFVSIFGEAFTERAKYFLLHALQLIKDNPSTTILDLSRVYYDNAFRKQLVANTTNPATLAFWEHEHPSFSKRYIEEAPGTIYNKIGQFLASSPIRACLTQQHPKFDFETAIRFKQIVVVNVAKGRVGRENASLFGGLLLSHLHSIIFEGAVGDCNLYVDEFQSFGTDIVADMLSEDAKFGLHATLANQYFAQLREANQEAILGNIGALVAFKVGSRDAAALAPEFNRDSAEDYTFELKHQPPFHAYVRRPTGEPQSIHVAPPTPGNNPLQKVIEASRMRFARRL